MKYETIWHKQVTLGRQYAHLAEHILASLLSLEFKKRAYLPFLDYQFDAMTRDNIILLWLKTNSSDIFGLFQKIIKDECNYSLADEQITKEIQRITVEYAKLAEYDIKKLKANLKQVFAQDWQDCASLVYSKPTQPNDWSFSARGLNFENDKALSKKIKSSVVKMTIRSPKVELKPLAYYVLCAINQIFEDILYNNPNLPEIYNNSFLNGMSFHTKAMLV